MENTNKEDIKDVEQEQVEQAAKEFTESLPMFKKLIKAIDSKKGLERVLYAALEFPLGKDYPKFKSHNEWLAFSFFNQVSERKQLVLQDILLKNYLNQEKETKDGKEEQSMASDRNTEKER